MGDTDVTTKDYNYKYATALPKCVLLFVMLPQTLTWGPTINRDSFAQL